MLKRIAFVWLIASASLLGGCGLFDSACGAAMPAIAQAQAYGDDASASLSKLQLTFNSMDLDASARAKVNAAMSDAWTTLKAGQASLIAASDACSGVDAILVFNDFIKAWKLLQVLLGEHSSQLQAAASPDLYAPAIVRKAAGQ